MVRPFGDNEPYAQISSAIRHWDFSQLHPKLFWGLPYAVAVLSKATGASDLKTLLFISMVSSLIAILIAYRLWGGWVAGFFAVASREWMERSLLGGAEPLFLACIFGAFAAARKQRWLLASLLASLATIVRPMGIFALVGIGIALLVKRDFRRFIAAVLIGATIGLLYILPLMFYLGNPLANVKGYDQADWNGGVPLTIPLVAIAEDALAGRATKLNAGQNRSVDCGDLGLDSRDSRQKTFANTCGSFLWKERSLRFTCSSCLPTTPTWARAEFAADCHSYSPICNSGFASLDSERSTFALGIWIILGCAVSS